MLRWFDPTTGESTVVEGAPFSQGGKREVAPPRANSAGEPDWVLFCQTASPDDARLPVNRLLDARAPDQDWVLVLCIQRWRIRFYFRLGPALNFTDRLNDLAVRLRAPFPGRSASPSLKSTKEGGGILVAEEVAISFNSTGLWLRRLRLRHDGDARVVIGRPAEPSVERV